MKYFLSFVAGKCVSSLCFPCRHQAIDHYRSFAHLSSHFSAEDACRAINSPPPPPLSEAVSPPDSLTSSLTYTQISISRLISLASGQYEYSSGISHATDQQIYRKYLMKKHNHVSTVYNSYKMQGASKTYIKGRFIIS